jgi:hypothetical protein
MKEWSRALVIVVIILIVLGVIAAVLLTPPRDLRKKCCAECIAGFEPQWDSPPYCVNKQMVSKECIDFLGIGNVSGASTASAYADKCGA